MTRPPGRRLIPTFAVLALLAACADSGPADIEPGDPPALPPLASMQADMSLFDQASPGALGSAAAAQVGTHFFAAGLTVTVARVATVIVMALPVATFGAAAQNNPVFEDGAFHWRYSVTEAGNSFSAHLIGRGEGQESVWEMRVSATGTNPPLDDFLWYTGRAGLDGMAGEWHVFDPLSPSSATEVLAIDWTHTDATAATLSFRNVNPGAAQTGDRLDYGTDGNLRTVSYVDVSEASTVLIQWDAVTLEGFIEAPAYNGGVRACWDGSLENVPCAG